MSGQPMCRKWLNGSEDVAQCTEPAGHDGPHIHRCELDPSCLALVRTQPKEQR